MAQETLLFFYFVGADSTIVVFSAIGKTHLFNIFYLDRDPISQAKRAFVCGDTANWTQAAEETSFTSDPDMSETRRGKCVECFCCAHQITAICIALVSFQSNFS